MKNDKNKFGEYAHTFNKYQLIIVLSRNLTYLASMEKSQINDLSLHLQKLGKEFKKTLKLSKQRKKKSQKKTDLLIK